MTRQIQPGNIFFTARATRVENGFIVRPVARGHLKNEEIDAYYSFDMLCCLSQNFKYFLRFIGNSYLAAGGVAFRSVPRMGHFCAVPPGRMLFSSSYGSLWCGSSWPHARIQKTVADEDMAGCIAVPGTVPPHPCFPASIFEER